MMAPELAHHHITLLMHYEVRDAGLVKEAHDQRYQNLHVGHSVVPQRLQLRRQV